MPATFATLDELGLPAVLYLGALSVAQHRRLRVAPTRRMTVAVMDTLRHLELIAVPWPDGRWDVQPDARETPIEQMQWRLLWTTYVEAQLADAAIDALEAVPDDAEGCGLRLNLWRELIAAEAEHYFETQLAQHGFDSGWAHDLAFAMGRSPELSAAQWRYCCWAAVRHGTQVALRHANGPSERVRDAIFSELGRRALMVRAGQWATNFVPYQTRPDNALTYLFVTRLTRLGPRFWTDLPDEFALLAPGDHVPGGAWPDR